MTSIFGDDTFCFVKIHHQRICGSNCFAPLNTQGIGIQENISYVESESAQFKHASKGLCSQNDRPSTQPITSSIATHRVFPLFTVNQSFSTTEETDLYFSENYLLLTALFLSAPLLVH